MDPRMFLSKSSSCVLLMMAVILTTIPPPGHALESLPIGHCLELTGGLYNIGCPTFRSNPAVCFLNGTASDPSNPYSRLCDGVDDCPNNLSVDEGSNITFSSNGRLDCKQINVNMINLFE